MATIAASIRWATNMAELREQIQSGADAVYALQTAAEKTSRSLGGEGLFRAAHNLVAAIGEVNNVSKLTGAEQERVSRTLDKAIEKYQLLGKTAPSAMVAIAEATRKTVQPVNQLAVETERISKQLGGGGGIQSAQAYVNAVNQIGGAAKLTANEQRQVNTAVTEAIAKYRALGQSAPADMIKLAEATKQLPAPLTMADKAAGLLKSTFGQFTLAGLATTAIGSLTSEVQAFIAQGQKLPALQSSFNRLTMGLQQDGQLMLANMTKSTRGMVSNYDLLQSANKAMLLGLPVTSESMGEMANAATKLGKAMGQDATKSLDDMITALGRSSPMILDNLGLTVKVGEANETYAAKLHKTVEQLTDAEKKMAFYEAAMEAARRKTAELGEQTMTLGEIASAAWTKIGNVISATTATINVGVGRAISSGRELALFAADVVKSGFAIATVNAQLRDQIANAPKTKVPDINLPSSPAQQMAALQAAATQLRTSALAPLTAEQERLVIAFNTGGKSAEKIVEEFKKYSSTSGIVQEQVERVIEASKKGAKAGDDYARAIADNRAALIPLTEAQRASVDAMLAQGLEVGNIAKELRVSTVAVNNHAEAQKRAMKIAEDWSKVEHDIAAASSKLLHDQTKAFLDAEQAKAKVSSDGMMNAFRIREEFAEKNIQLHMTGAQLEIRQLELSRQAEVAKLGMRTEANKRYYDEALALINKFYRDKAVLETSVEARARAAGFSTRAELERQADAARKLYEDMKAAGTTFYDWEIEAARRAAEQAEASLSKMAVRIRQFKAEIRNISLDFAHDIASAMADGIATGDWSQLENNLKAALAQAIGSAAAAAVNMVLPGLGSALQPLFTALSDKLLGFLGLGTKGRDMVKEFAAVHKDFNQLHQELLTLGPDGERMWIALTQGVGRNNPEQAKRIIEEITKALERQEAALKNLSPAINARTAAFLAPLEAAKAKVDELSKSLKDAAVGSSESVDISARLVTAQMDLTKTREQLQPDFERLGIFATAGFAAGVRNGMSAMDMFRELKPTFDALQRGITEFGLASSAAIDQLLGMRAFVEANQPVFDALDADNKMLIAFRDSGAMTKELFQTIGADIGAQLEKIALNGGDVNQALALSQPTLQALWEAQQKYGMVVDETTQKYLKQAEEQGLVGAQMKSVNERILDVLLAIGRVLGADLPKAFEATAAAGKTAADGIQQDFHRSGRIITDEFSGLAGDLNTELGRIRPPKIVVGVEFDFPDMPDHPDTSGGHSPAPAATGGLVTSATILPFSRGGPVPKVNYFDGGGEVGRLINFIPKGTDTVPAMLTPGEIVVNAMQQRNLASAITRGGAVREREASGPSQVIFEKGSIVLENPVMDSDERVEQLANKLFERIGRGGKLQSKAKRVLGIAS